MHCCMGSFTRVLLERGLGRNVALAEHPCVAGSGESGFTWTEPQRVDLLCLYVGPGSHWVPGLTAHTGEEEGSGCWGCRDARRLSSVWEL